MRVDYGLEGNFICAQRHYLGWIRMREVVPDDGRIVVTWDPAETVDVPCRSCGKVYRLIPMAIRIAGTTTGSGITPLPDMNAEGSGTSAG